MKTLLGIGITLALFVLTTGAIGLATEETPIIRESIVIEAPAAVVWNTLLRFDEHDKWRQKSSTLYNHNYTHRQVRYQLDDATIIANQQVRVREGAKAVDFIEVGKEKYSLLEDLNGSITLQSLADGSTEVSWQVGYHVPGIGARLYHRFKLQALFQDIIRQNLQAFKEHIDSF